ncbi:SDR family oxidoreductase [Terribacillus sp. DMT04]|uniref:SDR family oxidoreductase n=1 Tax=Terribacillus sp. DMT04 TaxID=2850441 RepID=UPI001C2C2FF8|nr:SDR family oxidoreductase [Terribacillus sp. DMT04]QXE03277.1 SDR family oxidoreductase [Terribacillus sp. DMT04]
MDLGMKGKTALVVAASKGLGKATALQLAEEGAIVHILSRDEQTLKLAQEETIKASGNSLVFYSVCDVTDAQAIMRAVEAAKQHTGSIDILVNNAGGPPAGKLADFEDQDWQQAFELNLLSFVRFIRAVVPVMKKNGGGHILNIASSSIKQSIDNLLLSNTFRAGIVGLAKSLSQELAPDHILINTLGPGKIHTDRVDQLDQKSADQLGKRLAEIQQESQAAIPIGRYGKPEEFAKMAAFLVSSANTYVTGQAFVVDGGMVKAIQ